MLPLANLSGDPNQEFSRGNDGGLDLQPGTDSYLEVIGRTSVLRYKGTTKTAREIGRELGVDAVVEGSVQRSGGRVRIAAQLIRTSTDKDLWANHYDRDLSDVLKLESDVAQAIAQEIQAQVTPQELIRLKNARSVVPAAREEFLLGRYNLWKNSDEAVAIAIPHFERAIQLQPDYADAYANLALAWENRLPLGYPKPKEALEAARPAALKSLELDPTLSEAHVAMGTVDVYNWNWAGAEAHFQRAVELDLYNNLETCGCYTSYLWATGRFSESLNLADRFARADPFSLLLRSLMMDSPIMELSNTPRRCPSWRGPWNWTPRTGYPALFCLKPTPVWAGRKTPSCFWIVRSSARIGRWAWSTR